MQFILTILCVIATVVTVIGVVMAMWPVPKSYLVSDAALVSAAASVARGQFLAILGAIIATGTGIILAIRAKAAK